MDGLCPPPPLSRVSIPVTSHCRAAKPSCVPGKGQKGEPRPFRPPFTFWAHGWENRTRRARAGGATGRATQVTGPAAGTDQSHAE